MQNLSCQFKACKIPDDGPLGHSVMINPCFAVIIRLRSAIAGTISHFHLAYILGSLRQFNVYQKQVCSSSCSGAIIGAVTSTMPLKKNIEPISPNNLLNLNRKNPAVVYFFEKNVSSRNKFS